MRRPSVLIPALVVASTLAALAYVATPPRYVSSATLVMATTEYGSTEYDDPGIPANLTNPMLNFADSLRTAAAILIRAMNTPEVFDALGVEGGTTLVIGDGSADPQLLGVNGPFVSLSATGSSPEEVEALLRRAEEMMMSNLREWQSKLKAPERTFVTLAEVVPPSEPEADRSRTIRRVVFAFLAGLVMGLGGVYVTQRLIALRRRIRPGTDDDDADRTEAVPVGGLGDRDGDGAVRDEPGEGGRAEDRPTAVRARGG
ncbi:hypothetical protein [Nocardioides sp. YIM 152588]|uniref:hypothetical protein n=1 Tax=Nocardioides sp. YIM 152588 TaxID=3158259 RepID=UPI0032E4A52C